MQQVVTIYSIMQMLGVYIRWRPLIDWQAYRGDQRHRKKQPYITLKSNPSKVQKHLPGL